MPHITKDMLIIDVLEIDRGTAAFFTEIGMHCTGCAMARGETVEQACAAHNVDCGELVDKINDYLEDK